MEDEQKLKRRSSGTRGIEACAHTPKKKKKQSTKPDREQEGQIIFERRK
jgi:hypothetical protein